MDPKAALQRILNILDAEPFDASALEEAMADLFSWYGRGGHFEKPGDDVLEIALEFLAPPITDEEPTFFGFLEEDDRYFFFTSEEFYIIKIVDGIVRDMLTAERAGFGC